LEDSRLLGEECQLLLAACSWRRCDTASSTSRPPRADLAAPPSDSSAALSWSTALPSAPQGRRSFGGAGRATFLHPADVCRCVLIGGLADYRDRRKLVSRFSAPAIPSRPSAALRLARQVRVCGETQSSGASTCIRRLPVEGGFDALKAAHGASALSPGTRSAQCAWSLSAHRRLRAGRLLRLGLPPGSLSSWQSQQVAASAAGSLNRWQPQQLAVSTAGNLSRWQPQLEAVPA
jgi:hypothetical protein